MKTIVNKLLADELLSMAEIDQAMRFLAIKDENAWNAQIDEDNSTRLQTIVEAQGWPTISKVGTNASHAAWLLVQHAPSLDFMKNCLELMKQLPKDEVNPANVAYLEDRVLMMSGEPQIYGTQFQGKGKDLQVYPISEPEKVEERRASVGLGTFAENEARVRELYGG